MKSQLKLQLRFLSNEIRSDSLKIIVHKKNCKTNSIIVKQIFKNSKIKRITNLSILKKAAILEKESKKRKKNNKF